MSKTRAPKKIINNQFTPQTGIELGKTPPQARELEKAVIGAIMLEKEALNEVMDILKPNCFYVDTHQIIYSAIINLFKNSQPVDIYTVSEQLKKEGNLEVVGGVNYIAQLTNEIASSANIEFHAQIIVQKYIKRELIRSSSDIITKSYSDQYESLELLDEAESNLFQIAEGNMKTTYQDITKLVKNAISNLEELSKKTDAISGIPSGFMDLDKITSGFQLSDMIVIAARPGMGKTAFVLSLARNVAVEFKHAVAIFSLEMSSMQLVNRLITSETEISTEKLRKGNLEPYEWEQLNNKVKNISNAPIYIDDTPGINILEFRAKCRRLKSQHDIKLIVIDYLQLMSSGTEKGTREQEISHISRSIKGIAKELNIPIIALSQLSRNVETRGASRRPQLSDLRESGAIEQDADMVIFIYRAEYYNILEDEEGNSTQGMGEIIISKHRNGRLDEIKLRFISKLAKFTNIEFLDNLTPIDNIEMNQNFENNYEDKYKTSLKKSKMNDITDSNDLKKTPF